MESTEDSNNNSLNKNQDNEIITLKIVIINEDNKSDKAEISINKNQTVFKLKNLIENNKKRAYKNFDLIYNKTILLNDTDYLDTLDPNLYLFYKQIDQKEKNKYTFLPPSDKKRESKEFMSIEFLRNLDKVNNSNIKLFNPEDFLECARNMGIDTNFPNECFSKEPFDNPELIKSLLNFYCNFIDCQNKIKNNTKVMDYKTLFKDQLDLLINDMQFTNEENLIKVLMIKNGEIDETVEFINKLQNSDIDINDPDAFKVKENKESVYNNTNNNIQRGTNNFDLDEFLFSPENMYYEQLMKLNEMGYKNNEENLELLVNCDGNLDIVLDVLNKKLH